MGSDSIHNLSLFMTDFFSRFEKGRCGWARIPRFQLRGRGEKGRHAAHLRISRLGGRGRCRRAGCEPQPVLPGLRQWRLPCAGWLHMTFTPPGRPVDGNAATSCSSDVTTCFFTNWANSVLFLARRLVPSTQRGAPAHEMHADTYTTQRGSHHVPSRYQR